MASRTPVAGKCVVPKLVAYSLPSPFGDLLCGYFSGTTDYCFDNNSGERNDDGQRLGLRPCEDIDGRQDRWLLAAVEHSFGASSRMFKFGRLKHFQVAGS